MKRFLLVTWMLCGLAGCLGNGSTPPTIASQPADTSVIAGATASFAVMADGDVDTYQWQRSPGGSTQWTDIAGAGGATYTTSATLADDGLLLRVIVTGAGTTIISSAARLNVTSATVAPLITSQPAAVTTTAPVAAVFTASATGTTISFQWQVSGDGSTWNNVVGATTATFDTGSTNTGMNGQQYRVVVSNSAGSVTSSAALLTVNATPVSPVFATHPASTTASEGSTVTFAVAVTGVPAPTLQWEASLDGGGNWSTIAGATSASHSVTAYRDANLQLRVAATSSAGTTYSNVAILTVTTTCAFGSLTVNHAGSPTYGAFTEGSLCPTSTDHGPLIGQVSFSELINNFNESLVIRYDTTTKQLLTVAYYSGEMGAGTAWRCDPNPTFGPACGSVGIALSPAAGTVTFSGSTLREWITGETVTLNGTMTFPPAP